MIVEWTPNVLLAIAVYAVILLVIIYFVRGIGDK